MFCKKQCPSAFRVSSPPGTGGGGGGGQTSTKILLGQVWMCVKISSRSVQGFGFPLALHIPTDRQTNKCTPIFVYIDAKTTAYRLHESFGLTKIKLKSSHKQFDTNSFEHLFPFVFQRPEGPLDVCDVTATSCTLKWSPPQDDGGLPIQEYAVEKFCKKAKRWIKVLKEKHIS